MSNIKKFISFIITAMLAIFMVFSLIACAPVAVEEEKETTTPVVEKKELYSEHKKFKSSPVISPVYGIEHPTSTNANDIELENTANYEKLDEEIRKTNEFLMTLKELQKKLD